MALKEGKEERIGDLVEIPEIKTVIQLEDLKDPRLSRMILETFVLTREVRDNLTAILASLTGGEGRGIFLKGHFGSGKSHFLGMLSLLLRFPESWEMLTSQSLELADFERELKDRRFFTVDVSLVQYRASEFLEDIILRSILNAFKENALTLPDQEEGRHAFFTGLQEILKEQGYTGMVFMVDELSEFLRSKADARAYNEDIRFLQYLGEEAGAFPFWVIATLQEWIEETGEIHQDTFNKIKDRYPVRLSLGQAHIEELVSERLIRHREGADVRIGALFDELKAYFPSFQVTRERFVRLYPVHPTTSWLLDRLKALFSEHRGVVDFIHFRLKGDPERQIPSRLDRPARELLTPEIIFDHFVERIRERAETQIYVERVFEGYREEIPEIFKDPDQQKIALNAIKLLILFTISPSQFKNTARSMAEMILFPITSLDTEINYQFLQDILDRLAKEGSYVRVEPHADPTKNHYFLDLKADISGILRRRIRHMASQFFPEDRRLFTQLAPMVESPYLPLAGWFEAGRQNLHLQWQHTRRGGTLQLRQLDEISKTEIRDLAERWARDEEDFFVLVGTPHRREEQFTHVKENLLPFIREAHPGLFLFWLPTSFDEDSTVLKEVLAATLMRRKLDPDASEKEKQTESFLDSFIQGRKERLTEAFHRIYFHGNLLWDENKVELSRLGYLTQEKFLTEFIHPLLERRFPGHARVQPYMNPLLPGILKEMVGDFLSNGHMVADDPSRRGLRDVLEGILKPMGLIRKNGRKYELQVNPRQNELVRVFLEKMDDRETVPVEEMYWAFRKGEYGLLTHQFEILVLAMLFSGNLVAYKGMFRKGPEELSRTGIKGITSLGKGEVLTEALQQAISSHPLISRSFKNVPVTLTLQEELWNEIKDRKAPALEELESMKSRIRWAAGFEAFRNMPWEAILRDMDDLGAQWEEVKVSLPSREGLGRFISAGQGDPSLEKKLKDAEMAHRFLDQAERILFVHQYIKDQTFVMPSEETYVQSDPSARHSIQEPGHETEYTALRRKREEIITFFDEKRPFPVSEEALADLFRRFQRLRDSYCSLYVEAHGKERGKERFRRHEELLQSRRYQLLKRLDKLEMVSVEHNRRSVEHDLSAVLEHCCNRSPMELLPAQPRCSCGFQLGETLLLKPVNELEREIDEGILETLAALKAPAIQEKIIPYLEGLDLVEKGDEAEAVRRFLTVSPKDEAFLDRLDRALTPQVIFHINEAFHGKVLVVERNVDRLYQSLVHRKYTLSQTRKIIREWLEQETLSEDTFFHFVGKGEERHGGDQTRELFREFLEGSFAGLASLYRRMGFDQFARAMFATLWAGQYQIPPQEVMRLFPAAERDLRGEQEPLAELLMKLGGALMQKETPLFETVISLVEEDGDFIQALWSALPDISPMEIFRRESIFSLIVKEAFERIMGGNPGKKDLNELLRAKDADRGHGRFQERKKEMVQVLETCALFLEKGTGLDSPGDLPMEKFSRWESLFTRKLCELPALREKLREALKKTGIPFPPFLKQQERDMGTTLGEVVEDFRVFYRKACPLWEGGDGPRPVMIEDIPGLLSKKRQTPDYVQFRYLLMDGMRWDLWERIKTDFFGKMPHLFRLVREGALWAHSPTDTAHQLSRFEEALHGAGGAMEDESPLWKLTGIDEKIHSEKGPLSHLFANVVNYLEIDWHHRLKRLPSRTLLILFADHGFVENPAFDPSAKYESPRYLHGKDSPFEVIVPWAWVMRI